MLMVATVMISSASFAWFTISTQPEVSGVEAGLATNQALEIALVSDAVKGFETAPSPSGQNDTGKNTTWGNLVDVSAYFNGGAATLRPALVGANKALAAPKFGEDGRTNGSAPLTSEYVAVDGTAPTTAYHDGVIKVYKDTTGAAYAYQIDYFMRTNVAGLDIKLLQTGADRGAGVAGAGTTITQDSICNVAFQVDGGDWKNFYDGNTKQFDFTTPIITGTVKDQVYKVSMLVYWDGSNATNANLALTGQQCAVNAQFTTSSTLNGIGVTGERGVSPKPTAGAANGS